MLRKVVGAASALALSIGLGLAQGGPTSAIGHACPADSDRIYLLNGKDGAVQYVLLANGCDHTPITMDDFQESQSNSNFPNKQLFPIGDDGGSLFIDPSNNWLYYGASQGEKVNGSDGGMLSKVSLTGELRNSAPIGTALCVGQSQLLKVGNSFTCPKIWNFNFPWGIALDPKTKTIYMADYHAIDGSGEGQVFKLTPTNPKQKPKCNPCSDFNSTSLRIPAGPNGAGPNGLTLDTQNGRIYLTEDRTDIADPIYDNTDYPRAGGISWIPTSSKDISGLVSTSESHIASPNFLVVDKAITPNKVFWTNFDMTDGTLNGVLKYGVSWANLLCSTGEPPVRPCSGDFDFSNRTTSGNHVIPSSSNPEGITLDEYSQLLYWTDGKGLYVTDLNGVSWPTTPSGANSFTTIDATGVQGRSTTVETLTLSAASNAVIGDVITVKGVVPEEYNGTFVVTAVSNTAPFTVSYKQPNAEGTTDAQSSAGSVSLPYNKVSTSTTEIFAGFRSNNGQGALIGNAFNDIAYASKPHTAVQATDAGSHLPTTAFASITGFTKASAKVPFLNTTKGKKLTCVSPVWETDRSWAKYYDAPRTVTYQWYKDGVAIPLATAAAYTVPKLKTVVTLNSYYSCKVTATNFIGSTTVESATSIKSIK